ncbi:MAG: IclR family transcriptional regulator domain-containing protein, partial [Jiangellaceae bacterium]
LGLLRAELDRVRVEGVSVVDQELELGLISMAVPVTGPGGEVVAALNVPAHAPGRRPTDMRRDLLPPLEQTALAIGAELCG